MSALLHMYPGDAWVFRIGSVLVQITVVILLALVLARARRSNAAWRHAVQVVALICLLTSPLLTLLMEAGGITLIALRLPESHTVSAVPSLSLPDLPALELSPGGRRPVGPPMTSTPSERATHGSKSGGMHSLTGPDVARAAVSGILAIWLMGSVWLLVRWCHGLSVVAAIRRQARPWDGAMTNEMLDEVRQALQCRDLPPIAVSARLNRPVMIGLIRPLVILPENVIRAVKGAKLTDILIHECAHVACRHQGIGFLQRIAAVLFWPHPLLLALNRELARAREEVCDNYVLRRGAATRYARTLLDLAQSTAVLSTQPVGLGLLRHRWTLEVRIAGLLEHRRKTMISLSRRLTGLMAVLFLAVAAMSASVRVLQAEPAREAEPAVKSRNSSHPEFSEMNVNRAERSDASSMLETRDYLRELRSIVRGIVRSFWYYTRGHESSHEDLNHIDALRRIGQALDAYEQKHGTLPPAYVADETGRPMHSWRVLVLPFLGHQQLFDRYRFDEPWNGPNNIALADQMPKEYRVPGSNSTRRTSFMALTGDGTLWPGATASRRVGRNDLSSKVWVVEAAQVPLMWLEPRDIDVRDVLRSSKNVTPWIMFGDFRTAHLPEGLDGDLYRRLLRFIITGDRRD